MITYKSPLNQKSLVFLILYFILSVVFLGVIPPLKSPDEGNHFERAYLFSKGQILLEAKYGESSGGYIDTGLIAYQRAALSSRFTELGEEKITREISNHFKTIRWTGIREYDRSPGTGYYLPVAYFPQALGLTLGEALELSVHNSYILARFLTVLASTLILGISFSLYTPSHLTLVLLSMPMALFLTASGHIDPFVSSLAVLAVSIFLRYFKSNASISTVIYYILGVLVTIISATKIHCLPLLFLILGLYYREKNRHALYAFLLSLFFVLVWTGLALSTTVDLRVQDEVSTVERILYYLYSPTKFIGILFLTVSDTGRLFQYLEQFIGVLGRFDTPLSALEYNLMTLLLLTTIGFSLSRVNMRLEIDNVLLAITSLSSSLIIFTALLVSWTPHPAQLILGVQGRYFFIPAMLLSYIAPQLGGSDNIFRQKVLDYLVIVFLLFSSFATFKVVIERYYQVRSLPDQTVKTVVHPAKESLKPLIRLVPSPALSERESIGFELPKLGNTGSSVNITKLGLLVATYKRTNAGEAELILFVGREPKFRESFNLEALEDNTYKYFYVPAYDYTSGVIRSLSGGGVSLYKVTSGADESLNLPCLDIYTALLQRLWIHGCPPPP